MPLKRGDSTSFGGTDPRLPVVMEMIDPTGRVMTISVSDMALDKFEANSKDSPSAVFLKHREMIELAASRKFDNGVAGSRLTIMSSDV